MPKNGNAGILTIAGVFLAVAILSCCSLANHGGQKNGPVTMLFSPNGEPLNGGPLGRPACREAMSRWFDRVDANHDGAVSRDEFLADAKIQFQRMDIDKNGYLLAEELDRFRLPYEQQEAAGASAQAGSGGNRRGGNRGTAASPADEPDPVMSADTNNDFKVTSDEFMTQARSAFAGLDASHKDVLDRDDALKTCDKKPQKDRSLF